MIFSKGVKEEKPCKYKSRMGTHPSKVEGK